MADEQALLDLIARSKEGVLAVVKSDGYPQLSNIYYLWDPAERVARISTTADRVKGRVLRRNPHAALHVAGSNFFEWAVAEGDAELSDVSTTPGDEVAQELLPLYESFAPRDDMDAFYAEMVEQKRLVVRLRAKRVYGLAGGG
jgi:PPOX class probable F420-dependent enzyme